MARRRFFVDHVRHGVAAIAGEEAAHLTRVLRVEKGQRYELSDNQRLWLAEVTEARKSLVEFRVLESLDPGPDPAPLDLYAALFKFDRFEWMVEKVTELGIRRLIPVLTARTEKGLDAAAPKRSDRWRRIAREASQQSRRARLPEIASVIRLDELPREGVRLLLDEEPGGHRMSFSSVPVSLLIGPEGGWVEEERDALRARGWCSVSMGPTILRAETAAVAAVAVALHEIRKMAPTLHADTLNI